MRKIKRVDKFNKNLKQLSQKHPDIDASITGTLDEISRQGLDLPPGTSPLSKLDLGPFEVHSMV